MSHNGYREVIGVRVFHAGDTHGNGDLHHGVYLTEKEECGEYAVALYLQDREHVRTKAIRKTPIDIQPISTLTRMVYPLRKWVLVRVMAVSLIFG